MFGHNGVCVCGWARARDYDDFEIDISFFENPRGQLCPLDGAVQGQQRTKTSLICS